MAAISKLWSGERIVTVNGISNSQSVPQTSTGPTYSAPTGMSSQSLFAQLTQTAQTGSPVEQGRALAQLDQMYGSRQASNAAVASPGAKAPETCTVEVRYTPIFDAPVVRGIANHAFIVTRDGDSTSYFRGGPLSRENGLNSGSSNSGSSGSGQTRSSQGNPENGIYGTIVTEHGAYRPRTVDWTTNPSGQQTVAVRAGNCDALDMEFARHADDIEAARINYGPLAANSNSTVREILERAGFGNVRPVVNAPSWDIQLPEAR